MEFWNDQATDKSWNALIELSKKYEFILIGGWACYFYTGTIKSHDVDMIVGFETLAQLKREFLVKKIDILKKYEIIYDEISDNNIDSSTDIRYVRTFERIVAVHTLGN